MLEPLTESEILEIFKDGADEETGTLPQLACLDCFKEVDVKTSLHFDCQSRDNETETICEECGGWNLIHPNDFDDIDGSIRLMYEDYKMTKKQMVDAIEQFFVNDGKMKK